MSKFEKLYHKVLSDEHFRKELIENPSTALESIGIDPTPEVLSLLENVEAAVRELEIDLAGPDATIMMT